MEELEANLTLTACKGSPIPHTLLLLSLPLSLAAPPFRFRRQVTSVIIIALATVAHINTPFTQELGDAQPWSLIWPNTLAVLTATLCSGTDNPEHRFWRVDRVQNEAMKMCGFGPAKLQWAAAMVINLRGVRWSHQVKNLPRQTPTRKDAFLAWRALDASIALAMTDLLLQLSIRLFWSSAVNSKYHGIGDKDWRWSLAKAAVYGSGPYFFMRLQYDIFSLVAIGTCLSQPVDWPPLFGEIKDVTTVRLFWGKFWHQSIRRPLTEISQWVVAILHVQRGTTASSYIQLFAAFSISGFLHAQSMLMLPCPINLTFSERTVGIFMFFAAQAVAISAEDLVQWVYKSCNERAKVEQKMRWRTLLGYLWVIVWFWYSLPMAGNVMLRLRMTEKSFLPFTFFGPWVQMLPVPRS